MSSELKLKPNGVLAWQSSGEEEFPGLSSDFSEDWRQGLFALGAEKGNFNGSPILGFWQGYARRYLHRFCHLPSDLPVTPSPAAEEFQRMVDGAPPMVGGEYLSVESLMEIWSELEVWAKGQVQALGFDEFLQRHARKWRQVGRVCFHLAENKDDESRPFAFLATFTTGLGASGRPKHVPLRKSLELFSKAQDKPALLKLLSPIHHAAETLPWVSEMLESGEIYQPKAWSVDRAYRYLCDGPTLEESGISVLLPNWWKRRPRAKVAVTIGNQKGSPMNAQALLSFDLSLAFEDQSLTPEEVDRLMAGGDGLVQIKGQWVEVDRERLREALDHWETLRRRADRGEITFIEGMRLLAGASVNLKQEDQADVERPWVHLQAGEELREVLAALRNPEVLSEDPGEGLQATLRDYQRTGVGWLRFLSGLGLGACLADDMGLGKTIQVLAYLLAQRRAGGGAERPSLLVVPASLLGNWRQEWRRFAPDLQLVFAHPSEADKGTLERLQDDTENGLNGVDLVVTTYSMVKRQKWLQEVTWQTVILDEAQAIKNPGARQTQAVKKLSAVSRIALTGTPVENRLGDLWSLFDFLNPGLLGTSATFKTFVNSLQQRSHDQFAPLRQLVGPYILRRLKTDRTIIDDLPDKIETPCFCGLTKPQIRLYEKTLGTLRSSLGVKDGVARRGLVLQTMMRLKQICNHPSQMTGDGDYDPKGSGKFARLAEIATELAERQERVLVFTQFREIIDPLADLLSGIFGTSGLVLHGGTKVSARGELVERFQREDGPPFFILSLKAGGTGLTLTRASHVIHFDRWWNPAVENQATDRAFRIGQKKNVQVHKFITRGTVEERIDEMISSKLDLANEVLGSGAEVKVTELSDEELMDLVRLDLSKASV